MDLVRIAPESLEVANAFLETGSASDAALKLGLPKDVVHNNLAKREVKAYLDQVYLDQGYRNRFRLAEKLDEIIDRKFEEAEESEMYSNKDLADLLMMAHKMRMDEIKAQQTGGTTIAKQTNVQFNGTDALPGGNYGKLMEQLLNHDPV